MDIAAPYIIGSASAIIGAVVASVIPAWMASKNGKKLDVIHVLVNSNLDSMKRELSSALTKITKLEKALEDKESEP